MRIRPGERTEASILHADLDSFYASVEQRDEPSLKGRPVIVGGGVVLAASYEAKAFGIRTAMGGRQALRLCPQVAVVRPHFEAYTAASRAVFDIFNDITPVVEGISIDEAFLDVGGVRRISGEPMTIARGLRKRVATEVGLPISVGIARSKFLAKVASAVSKPDGLLLVRPGTELEFLHPLPVRRLWGVGAVTERKLLDAGILTVGQLAARGENDLDRLLGRASGRHLYALSQARDPRRVEVGTRRGSIGSQRAIGWREHTDADLEATLLAIVERLGKRLRAASRTCRTVVLRLRFTDSGRATRSRSLLTQTDRTDLIGMLARDLFRAALPLIHERGCTLIGLSLTNLDGYEDGQPTLPFDSDHGDDLDIAMDHLRDRFGREAVTRAVLIGRHQGDDVPHLPD